MVASAEVTPAAVDAVPFMYATLGVDAGSVETFSATFNIREPFLESVLEQATERGYVRRKNGVYVLEDAGIDRLGEVVDDWLPAD